MKKRMGKIMGAVLMGSVLGLVAVQDTDAATYGDFEYSSDGSVINIRDYTGSGGAVTIPSEIDSLPVTSIGNSAFYDSSGLTSLTIPDSVTSIGEDTFSHCYDLTNIVLGNSLTTIGDFAFFVCTNLTSVVIPDSVTSIGNSAFLSCSSLMDIVLGSSVATIGDDAFAVCGALTEVTIPDSVTKIGNRAFYSCSDLTNVALGSGVTSIGDLAFYHCFGLTGVTIPDSVTSIGFSAFASCSNLTSAVIGNNVSVIGVSVFVSCSSLTNVVIGNSVTTIGDYAFSSCSGLTSVTIPDSVTSIGSFAFDSCSGLTNITMGNSVATIGDYAFYKCGLTSVTLPDSVTAIGSSTFYSCSSLTNVVIGNSVAAIGDHSFFGAGGLTSLTIPESVTNIGVRAFGWCNGLTNIAVEASNTEYCDVDGVLFSKDLSVLIQYPAGRTADTYNIPDGVTTIGDMAFSFCWGLTEIFIPNSVAIIVDHAFDHCSDMEGIWFQDDAPANVGADAFSYSYPTVYYRSGTMGWGDTFAGRPTEINYGVTFDAGAHGTLSATENPQWVVNGASASAPSVTSDLGWQFAGWDSDFSSVSSNMTVTALYSPAVETGIADHVSYINLFADYILQEQEGCPRYEVELEIEADSTVTAIDCVAPFGSFAFEYDSEDGEWEYWQGWPTNGPLPAIDGDWTISVAYTNGTTASTVVPFAQADGTTPLANVTTCPKLISPDAASGILPASDSFVWEWDSHFDVNATGADIGYSSPQTDDVIIYFSGGNLSHLSYDSLDLPAGTDEIWIANYAEHAGTNSDGIAFKVAKGAMYDHDEVVVVVDSAISNHVSWIDLAGAYDLEVEEYFVEVNVVADPSVTAVEGDAPFGHFECEYCSDEDEWEWEYGSTWPLVGLLPVIDGNWTITVTYTNGQTASTIIPFAQADGTTPLPEVATCPQLTMPNAGSGGILQASDSLVWEWDSHFDANATRGEIRWEKSTGEGDMVVFEDVGLNLLSYGPFALPAGDEEIFIYNEAYFSGINSDGIPYLLRKFAEHTYDVVVVVDSDSDILPDTWEQQYFGDTTNANPAATSANGVNTVLDAYVAGFDPTDPAAGFYAAEDVQGGDIVIEWPCIGNRIYSVYWATNLVDGFELIQTVDSCGSFTDTVHQTESTGYYKIDVQLP